MRFRNGVLTCGHSGTSGWPHCWRHPSPRASLLAQDLTLPKKPGSLKFAVIGDTGTGDSNQYRVARVLATSRQAFPFEFVVMVGDNLYGTDNTGSFGGSSRPPTSRSSTPASGSLRRSGIATARTSGLYKPFNMNGQRFYTFKPKDGVRFFALDSNYMNLEQLQWLEQKLKASGSDWKIAFFHHPLYSSAERHGSDTALKDQLEPLFVKYSVDLVLTGHDHVVNEPTKSQKGIQYFVVGNSAKLKKGDLETAASGLAEPGRHVATELPIELIERDAKGHRHGLHQRLVRPQREQQPADAFFAVLRGDEVEHGVRPMTVGVDEDCHRRNRARGDGRRASCAGPSAAHAPRWCSASPSIRTGATRLVSGTMSNANW